jgi:hypothetical protein
LPLSTKVDAVVTGAVTGGVTGVTGVVTTGVVEVTVVVVGVVVAAGVVTTGVVTTGEVTVGAVTVVVVTGAVVVTGFFPALYRAVIVAKSDPVARAISAGVMPLSSISLTNCASVAPGLSSRI